MRSLLYYVYYLRIILWRIFYLCYNYVLYVLNIKEEKVLTIKDREKVYSENQKDRFNKILSNEKVNYNCNIEKPFYIKDEYDDIMKEENTLEKKWKTRMLFQTTPQGNIMMYYDAYKLGFAYYSDESVVSYDVLNSCAMKYVEIYRCLDFFMDEYVMKDKLMPLKDIHFKEEVNDNEEKKKFSVSNNVFAKLKKNTKEKEEKSKQEKSKQEKSKEENEPERLMNKFICLGKINNMKLIQTVSNKKGLVRFKSPILEKLKFSDFKKMTTNK